MNEHPSFNTTSCLGITRFTYNNLVYDPSSYLQCYGKELKNTNKDNSSFDLSTFSSIEKTPQNEKLMEIAQETDKITHSFYCLGSFRFLSQQRDISSSDFQLDHYYRCNGLLVDVYEIEKDGEADSDVSEDVKLRDLLPSRDRLSELCHRSFDYSQKIYNKSIFSVYNLDYYQFLQSTFDRSKYMTTQIQSVGNRVCDLLKFSSE